MSRIAATFNRLRAVGRKAFIPFVVAGDPSLAATEQAVHALVRAGADLVEVGVPFSDPIADGPINQRAAHRALLQGITLGDVLDLVRRVETPSDVPVVLLSYFNPVLQYGLSRFATDAVASGVSGVVIPDLPPEESGEFIGAAHREYLDTIFLLAPTSTDERIRVVAERSTGFIYCVSLTGVTGVRGQLAAGLEDLVRRIKRVTDTPVCVGFGVSTPEQARQVAQVADGVIVGSALVASLEGADDGIGRLAALAGALRAGIDAS